MTQPLLSLCMIVRDEERTLGDCLASIRPWVDEMVVVDTGSQDNTVALAEQHGARVSHFAWCDDFSAARNVSLERARGSWLFWMDADDTIDEDNGRKLRQLVRQSIESSTLGFILQVHCPSGKPDVPTGTVVDHIKVFRNRPEFRFEGRIHEQILPAIRQSGGEVVRTDIHVVHSGHDYSPEAQQRKLQRDLRLIELDLEDRPDHPFVLFNLGMTLAHSDMQPRANAALERCLAVSDPAESHVRKAYALLVAGYVAVDQRDDAERTVTRALSYYPNDPELLFRWAPILQSRGQLEQAADVYRQILGQHKPTHFASVDHGIFGYLTRHNLAALLVELGQVPDAVTHWRSVVAEAPGFAPGWQGLADGLLRLGRFSEAWQLGESLQQQEPQATLGPMICANVDRARGEVGKAVERLEQVVQESPTQLEPWDLLCQTLMESGQWPQAAAWLERLAQQHPSGAVFRNLGQARKQLGDLPGAVAAWERSLKLRPGDLATLADLKAARGRGAQM